MRPAAKICRCASTVALLALLDLQHARSGGRGSLAAAQRYRGTAARRADLVIAQGREKSRNRRERPKPSPNTTQAHDVALGVVLVLVAAGLGRFQRDGQGAGLLVDQRQAIEAAAGTRRPWPSRTSMPVAADHRQDLAGDVAGAVRRGEEDEGGRDLLRLRRPLHRRRRRRTRQPSLACLSAGLNGVHTGPGATALTRMPRGAEVAGERAR